MTNNNNTTNTPAPNTFQVILSSPLGFPRTLIKFSDPLPFPTTLSGCVSYVGHPATKALLESLGATTAPGRWEGPAVGESYLSVPLAPQAAPRTEGKTEEVGQVDISMLRVVLCTRVE